MVLLCYLYLSIRKARQQEQLSLEFSDLVIEGLETERRRISRELHDAILPQLYGRAVSAQIRSICIDLMPPDFSCLSLKDALAQACVKFSARTGIRCACSIENELDFSKINAENQLHIYRMVQECFNNIEKHSKAASASLSAKRFLENILICVSDDGVGLAVDKGEGLGIRSIRQRATITGSKIDFISEAENGLMVRIELPLPR
jgi:signal transduction histidine kinase